jgi:hypothetical protein
MLCCTRVRRNCSSTMFQQLAPKYKKMVAKLTTIELIHCTDLEYILNKPLSEQSINLLS